MKKLQVTLLTILLTFETKTLFAEKMTFKPLFIPKQSGLGYLLILICLAAVILLLIKKNKQHRQEFNAVFKIDKKYLSSKTILYSIHYQNQHFLLIDNQHALVLHSLQEPL